MSKLSQVDSLKYISILTLIFDLLDLCMCEHAVWVGDVSVTPVSRAIF